MLGIADLLNLSVIAFFTTYFSISLFSFTTFGFEILSVWLQKIEVMLLTDAEKMKEVLVSRFSCGPLP